MKISAISEYSLYFMAMCNVQQIDPIAPQCNMCEDCQAMFVSTSLSA